MNKYILIAIIVVLGVSGYFFVNSQKRVEHSAEDMGGKPIAQSHRDYEIEVTSNTSDIQPDKETTIKYKIKNDKGEIVKNYETVHEKIMHFITVRKDLAYFQHLHPNFNKSTGEFTVEVVFPEHGTYRIFPDFTPGEENPQKLPVTVYYDIKVGDSERYAEQKIVPDSEQVKTYGDYKVDTIFPKNIMKQQEITYTLSITESGKPVTNLENYLGALGHSVILREGTLDFIHTHALEAVSDSATQGHTMTSTHNSEISGGGPEVSFATNFPEAGVYKIFTQFKHQGEVQTANYIVKVN